MRSSPQCAALAFPDDPGISTKCNMTITVCSSLQRRCESEGVALDNAGPEYGAPRVFYFNITSLLALNDGVVANFSTLTTYGSLTNVLDDVMQKVSKALF